MILVKQESVGKGRIKLFFDDDTSFVLYRGEAAKLALSEGMEISEELYEQILQDILLKRAKLRCMNLLKSMDQTEYQLRTKLIRGGYPECVTELAIEYVKGFHYVDDVRYATAYIESRSKSRSARQIKQELMQKGVSAEDMEQAFSEAETTSETQVIRELARKKKMNLENPEPAELQKYYGFFVRKGFSFSAVRKVLQKGEVCEENNTFT